MAIPALVPESLSYLDLLAIQEHIYENLHQVRRHKAFI